MENGYKDSVSIETKEKIKLINDANPYVDITPYELGVGYPFVNYEGVVLKPKEAMIFVVEANSVSEKQEIVGYEGRISGREYQYSEHRSRIREKTTSKAIRGNVKYVYNGELIITNKRIIFIGNEDCFQFDIEDIASYKITSNDSFLLQSDDMFRKITVDEDLFEYTTDFIRQVINANEDGIDIYQAIAEADRNMSIGDRKLIERISSEVKNLKIYRPIPISKIMIPIVVVIILIKIIFPSITMEQDNIESKHLNNQENQILETSQTVKTSKVETNYDNQLEFLKKEDHPIIFDDIKNVKSYYANVKDKKIMVIDKTSSTGSRNPWENDCSLYLVEDKGLLNSVHINLFDPKLSDKTSVDDVMSLAVEYLPENFLKSYEVDRAYKYEDLDKKGYSCFLKLKSTEKSNVEQKYPKYYSINMENLNGTNKWMIETDDEKITSESLEWVSKFADEWKIDLSKY